MRSFWRRLGLGRDPPASITGLELQVKVGTKLKARVEKRIGANTLWIETGELAKQAAGSCVVGYGETVVLCAVVTGPPRVGIDFFPLTCDYRERVAAAGRFPGGFLKREGRPTTREVLTSRLIDRPIRPLFPEWFRDEVQIQAFVLAADRQNDPDVLAMIGASAALAVSPLPFLGPIASVRLGLIEGRFVVFPTEDQLETSDLNVIVSGSKASVQMIEGFARELPEDRMAEAISTAHQHITEVIGLVEELAASVQPVKLQREPPPPDPLPDLLRQKYYDAIREVKQTPGKQARVEAGIALKAKALAEIIPDPDAEGAISAEAFDRAYEQLEERVVRDLVLSGRRPDGRGPKELRDIT